MRNRISVMHGVNFDALERRRAEIYGGMTLTQLERRIGEIAHELGLEARFFQTNFEGEYVEEIHRAPDYSDAIELAGLPAVEVHLTDVMAREEFRRTSVIRDVCVASVWGKGVEGYREALAAARDAISKSA